MNKDNKAIFENFSASRQQILSEQPERPELRHDRDMYSDDQLAEFDKNVAAWDAANGMTSVDDRTGMSPVGHPMGRSTHRVNSTEGPDPLTPEQEFWNRPENQQYANDPNFQAIGGKVIDNRTGRPAGEPDYGLPVAGYPPAVLVVGAGEPRWC